MRQQILFLAPKPNKVPWNGIYYLQIMQFMTILKNLPWRFHFLQNSEQTLQTIDSISDQFASPRNYCYSLEKNLKMKRTYTRIKLQFKSNTDSIYTQINPPLHLIRASICNLAQKKTHILRAVSKSRAISFFWPSTPYADGKPIIWPLRFPTTISNTLKTSHVLHCKFDTILRACL